MANFNRENRSGPRRGFGKRGFGRHDGGRREMYKAVCANCGGECEVPFEPRDGRPVYCSECFEKKEGGTQPPRNFQDRGPRRPDFGRQGPPRPHNNEQLEEISNKLDKILELLTQSYIEKTEVSDKKKPRISKKKLEE